MNGIVKQIIRHTKAMKKVIQYIYIYDIEITIPNLTEEIEMVKLVLNRGKKTQVMFS